MEYVIFIFITCSSIFLYHWYKYKKSNYSCFDYYLYSKSDTIGLLCVFTRYVLWVALIVGIIYLGGKIVSIFI